MFTAEEWFESQIIEIERMREANHASDKRLAEEVERTNEAHLGFLSRERNDEQS
jgi:hypothetical protein